MFSEEEQTRKSAYAAVLEEHGIGRAKRDELKRLKGEAHRSILRAVKAGLDPQGLMNPGVLI